MERSRETIREPAVAGRFYPHDAGELSTQVESFLQPAGFAPPQPAVAVMVPHAGLVYSGKVAGQVFAEVEIPERVIILAPNHTGRGPQVSVMASGQWRMPGGEVAVDERLAAELLAAYPRAQADTEAHAGEHAIEVELPFLVARRPGVRIVPVVLGMLSELEAVHLGQALATAIAAVGDEVLVVASSDMSHFLSEQQARRIDRVALEPLLEGEPEGLYRTVQEHRISMCGFIPATVMLAYARQLGRGTPRLVSYATSADAFGDSSRVVGYAGVILS
ncbi:AmmeMemoRadiSam system protein B [Haliangium ochraceum]|uniref:MEMO1 family protein Hoch_5677 n=1 Tax=Haliangium ochraceum (strain DSM 14365 / JCM 11303 / SMP-2) TaxID=502025 RepID=D0LGC9_HALO1|nr:AmmeMemoRadiSam system protein B [Haliangium ochraceum]ACY18154.1 protein of unknown function DUF52 [Haliangium ochraceum DSM 14365]